MLGLGGEFGGDDLVGTGLAGRRGFADEAVEAIDELSVMAQDLKAALEKLQKVTLDLTGLAATGKVEEYLDLLFLLHLFLMLISIVQLQL